uniref:Uncharacterized protein n=1 Tax=Plectus sambesii TaxID=2011161 RepID=A0A914UQR2_9BILA
MTTVALRQPQHRTYLLKRRYAANAADRRPPTGLAVDNLPTWDAMIKDRLGSLRAAVGLSDDRESTYAVGASQYSPTNVFFEQ